MSTTRTVTGTIVDTKNDVTRDANKWRWLMDMPHDLLKARLTVWAASSYPAAAMDYDAALYVERIELRTRMAELADKLAAAEEASREHALARHEAETQRDVALTEAAMARDGSRITTGPVGLADPEAPRE